MTSLSITPQITLKRSENLRLNFLFNFSWFAFNGRLFRHHSSSAVETRRTYTITASQKSPLLIGRLSRFRNFTSRFRMSVDNGGSNRSGDRIGAGDAVIIVDHGSRRRESNLMLSKLGFWIWEFGWNFEVLRWLILLWFWICWKFQMSSLLCLGIKLVTL